jgi:hypothetical protein
VINDYRISHGSVEFRVLDREGHSLRNRESDWQKLTMEELSMHLVLNTIVAEWLYLRLDAKSWRKILSTLFRNVN